ncbi:MAG TPA: 4Fe-4S binding protein [Candidatus Methanoperedenaceae archaeon]|nr:4Fe-4S binding protein [Candidatus Methanoperedenaceae archaeon]
MVVKTYKTDNWTIEIDHDKCNGDSECIRVCPVEVFELVDGKSTAPKVEDCIECCACVDGCPTKAIKHSSC